MSKIYNVVKKEEYNGKVKWNHTGLKLIEKDGKFYLIDERYGTKFYCFENQPRAQKQEPQQQSTPDFDDDIPF